MEKRIYYQMYSCDLSVHCTSSCTTILGFVKNFKKCENHTDETSNF